MAKAGGAKSLWSAASKQREAEGAHIMVDADLNGKKATETNTRESKASEEKKKQTR